MKKFIEQAKLIKEEIVQSVISKLVEVLNMNFCFKKTLKTT